MKILLAKIVRGKKGQIARTDEIIEAAAIQIGRATHCNIYLADARADLQHATIHKGAAADCTIEAAGSMQVDGSFERAARLKVEQKIQLGPYTIIVLPTPDGVDLALSLELSMAAANAKASRASRKSRIGLEHTWLSKRMLSWALGGLVTLLFLVWPLYHMLYHIEAPKLATSTLQPTSAAAASPTFKHLFKATDAWNPGPLDSGHASFGRDCGKCHQQPFVQVKNDACESCHKTIGWHFPLEAAAAKTLHKAVFGADESEGRCAACHRDHKGVNALKRQDSPLCTNCHQDLKTRHQSVDIDNVINFSDNHPPFKLSMLIPGKTGKDALVRIAQDDKAAAQERSNLKFPHDVHLTKKGVRSPSGKVEMTCKNCHTPDETGTRFKPVTMKDHCQSCHSLEFEPMATKRQVPHGNVDDVIATVNEFYSQAALFNKAIDGAAQGKNTVWVNQKAKNIVSEMMEKRTCFICHDIQKTADSWTVAPILITQHWLPKSRFPHSQHDTHDCAKCHDVANSTSSSDIAIPDIKNCRSCHAGNFVEVDKAPGTCETCHGFHLDGTRVGKPAVLPKSNTHTTTSAHVVRAK